MTDNFFINMYLPFGIFWQYICEGLLNPLAKTWQVIKRETMGSAESYIVCDSEISKKRIEDIDLAEVARSYRILDRFMSFDDIIATHRMNDEEESPDTSIKMRLIDFLMCNKRYYVERQIALRMMFESVLGAPQHLWEVERALGIRLTDAENEE